MEVVGRAKKRQPYRFTYSEDECRAIVANAADRRDRIAARLLLYHGLRKSELGKVQIKHFDYPRRRLTVFGKGGKVATVQLPEPAFWTDLERYVLEAEAQNDHYLMCLHKPVPCGTPDRRGKRKLKMCVFPDTPMAATTLHNWWYRKLLEPAGIVEPGERSGKKMHAARHTTGQRILDKTGDLKLAQKTLRHASIVTTGDLYLDYNDAQQAEKLARVLEDVE
jgi:integrase